MRRVVLLITMMFLWCGLPLRAAEQSNGLPTKKVLILGIDGLRPDALIAANTPNVDRLLENGCFSAEAQTGQYTVSGPGWSSLLTGVWWSKHGVTDVVVPVIFASNRSMGEHCAKSSILPLTIPSAFGISSTTTSPSSLLAAHKAQLAPTLPPPMTEIFARRMTSNSSLSNCLFPSIGSAMIRPSTQTATPPESASWASAAGGYDLMIRSTLAGDSHASGRLIDRADVPLLRLAASRSGPTR